MSSYDSFAKYYDLVVGERPELAYFLRATIRQFAPEAKTLLELGSGSGSLLKVLSSYYQCTGIDNSRVMIRRARVKAPRAVSIVGDITDFELSTKFDAVICVFDTMNHIPTFSAWRSVFRNAAGHLNPGGVFIFDVNTSFKLERYVNEPSVAMKKGETTCVIEVARAKRDRYEVTLKAFAPVRGDTYRLHTLTIPESTFEVSRIRAEVLKHFSKVLVVDPNRDRPSNVSEELFFICRGSKLI